MSLTNHQELNSQGNFSRLCRNFITGVLLLLLSLLIVVPIDFRLSKIPETFDAKFISDNFLVPLQYFWPEQAEKAQFYFTVICLPLLIFILGMLNRKWKFLEKLSNQYRIIYVSALVIIALGYIADRASGYFYTQFTPYRDAPGLFLGGAVIFTGLYIYANKKMSPVTRQFICRLMNRIYYVVVVVMLALIAPFLLTRKANLVLQYFWDGSFDAYFYSIFQVLKGKSILVNILTQYGLYPYFYLPVLKLVGLDITTFSILQVILCLFFFLVFLLVLEKFVSNPFIKLVSFSSLVYFIIVLTKATPYTSFYQYYPHRALFPAAMVLFCLFYYRRTNPRKLTYLAGFLISGAAILWNMDTGVPVFGTWLLSLLFDDFVRNFGDARKIVLRTLQHILMSVATVLGAGLILYGFTYLRSGSWPQLAEMAFYQRVFYVYGYFMMPMQLFHAWNLVILVYVIGIIRSVMAIGLEDRPGTVEGSEYADCSHHKNMMVFILSILGVGLFSYFQGRSHYVVLAGVLWPSLLLVAIYFQEIETVLFSEKIVIHAKNSAAVIGMYLVYGFLILVSLIFTSGVFAHAKEIASYSLAQLSEASSSYPIAFQSEVDFLKANTHPNEQVLILAINGGILYAEADAVNPVSIPGVTELMAWKDLDKIIAYANDSSTKKLFVESEVLGRFPTLLKGLSSGRLKVTARDPYGGLILYTAQ